jgi:hypothetical protein
MHYLGIDVEHEHQAGLVVETARFGSRALTIADSLLASFQLADLIRSFQTAASIAAIGIGIRDCLYKISPDIAKHPLSKVNLGEIWRIGPHSDRNRERRERGGLCGIRRGAALVFNTAHILSERASDGLIFNEVCSCFRLRRRLYSRDAGPSWQKTGRLCAWESLVLRCLLCTGIVITAR